MPLTTLKGQNSNLKTIADGYTNFASMMAGNRQRQNSNSADALNREKTIAAQAENQAMAEWRGGLQDQIQTSGTMVEGNMAVDRPLTKKQIYANDNLNRMMAAGPDKTPWTFNNGVSFDTGSGRIGGGDSGTVERFNELGAESIQAGTFKDNAAGQKSIAEIANDSTANWDANRMSLLEQTPEKMFMSFREWVANGGDPKEYNNITNRMTDSQLKDETARYDRDPSVSSYKNMLGQMSKIRSMWDSGNEKETNIADNTMLTLYAKIMDEDSAVRGEEVTALIKGTGFVGIMNDLRGKFLTNGRLSGTDRDSFRYNAERLVDAIRKDAINSQQGFQRNAKKRYRAGEVVTSPIDEAPYPYLEQYQNSTAPTPRQEDPEEKLNYGAVWKQLEAKNPNWDRDKLKEETNRIFGM